MPSGTGNKKDILERRVFSTNEPIFVEGEKGSCAYLIQQGKVRIYVGKDGGEVTLAEVGMGQIVGDMALFDDEAVRSASVVAMEMTTVIEITRSTLRKKLDLSDPTIRALVTMMTQRIIKSNAAMVNLKRELRRIELHIVDVEKSISSSLPLMNDEDVARGVTPAMKDLQECLRIFKEEVLNLKNVH